jgi:hypothetical protein
MSKGRNCRAGVRCEQLPAHVVWSGVGFDANYFPRHAYAFFVMLTLFCRRANPSLPLDDGSNK